MKTTSLKAVDFFCGAGGMTLGMKMAGIKVIAGIDIDPDCQKTYTANHPEAKFFLEDVKTMPLTFLEKNCGVKRNDDSLVFIGCSPCQYWSILNTVRTSSQGTKDLLDRFWHFVRYYKPGYVVIENVPGIKRRTAESGLIRFNQNLERAGYKIADDIINAKYYGVPQSRTRFVLIASRVQQKIDLPKPGKESLLNEFIGTKNGFPVLRAGNRDENDFMNTVSRLTKINLERIKLTPKNGGTRDAWKDIPELQLNAYKGKDNSFKDVYGRLRWNKPSATITTRFNGISNGRFGHPSQNRGLSLKEGARLQTFPDEYMFKTESVRVASKLIGNAVPPELAFRIAQAICATAG